jgi:putative ATP-dependent endonuclease of the OLD family
MATIGRLVLRNFKRFKTLELEFDPELNILVGGNEAGKSSVLQALDIALSASRSKVEALGLETLFNAECIAEFLNGKRKITDLPEVLIELYLEGIGDRHELDGRNNSKSADHLGASPLTSTPRKFRPSWPRSTRAFLSSTTASTS